MSRFDRTRKGKIVVWTSAALAWGTALTMARLEPVRAEQTGPSSAPRSQPGPVEASALPSGTSNDLVILRFQPKQEETPRVRTIYVTPPAPTPKATPQPPVVIAPAPAPTSRGS